jgi:hypothetical protein
MQAMVQSTANVKTEHASKYLQQLCKHWSHKMETEFNPEKGKVVFPSGAVTTLAASPAELHLNIDADSGETLDRLEQVVADHIKRFAFREELEFVWNRGA